MEEITENIKMLKLVTEKQNQGTNDATNRKQQNGRF